MAARAGRNSRVYLNLASGGSASPVPFLTGITLNANTDTYDVTSFGDANHTYVSGLPDASGDITGFWDDTTIGTFTAAADGVARSLYFYPDIVNAGTHYFYGNVILDFKTDTSVTGAINAGGSFKAAGPMTWK
jgi:hypothetical protein